MFNFDYTLDVIQAVCFVFREQNAGTVTTKQSWSATYDISLQDMHPKGTFAWLENSWEGKVC